MICRVFKEVLFFSWLFWRTAETEEEGAMAAEEFYCLPLSNRLTGKPDGNLIDCIVDEWLLVVEHSLPEEPSNLSSSWFGEIATPLALAILGCCCWGIAGSVIGLC